MHSTRKILFTISYFLYKLLINRAQQFIYWMETGSPGKLLDKLDNNYIELEFKSQN